MRIDGKVVLITGASEGIGAACAAKFRERGAVLSLTARSEQKLREAGGPAAVVTAGDITDARVRAEAVRRTVERFGGIDVLVNNAGIGLYAPSWTAPIDQVRHMYELNVIAPVGMVQEGMPHLRAGAAIVNVSSIAGKVPLPWLALYSGSKYALSGWSDALRMELRPRRISVMTVCPGYVRTGFQQHVLGGAPPDRVLQGRRLAITAERCAADLVRGLERGARTVVTPRAGWILIALERILPGLIEGRMASMNEGV